MCMDIVKFFTYFMALDDSGRPEDSRTENDEDMVDDDSNSLDCLDDDSDCEEDYDSDCEEDSSDNEEGDDSEWKEMPRLINQQADEIIKKNENILRLEEENTAKARLIEELKEKVERLTEGGLDMERDITDLERLIQEKDRQICSLPAEMEKLRKEIALKAKGTLRG
ncbi:uncharacterized protein [Macrobrachium rosenbergii]|uniref:uncharacterized protein n=1 Tax=Macrobrachium rosenbergii TaxID=79674 RepID=UPI0034D4C692